MPPTPNDLIRADLKRDEGLKRRPYRDSKGLLTIGYGHNLATGLCDAAIDAQLDADIQVAEKSLDVMLPWWRGQPAAVQRVLANLAFNMGIGTLLTFHDFIRLVKASDYHGAAVDLLKTQYARDVKDRASRLAVLLQGVVGSE